MQIARSDIVEAKIKTYPDLSACCLRERLDLPLRLWYLLRQECPDGRGWLMLEDVYELSCGNRRQTRAWLRRGTGTFWTVDDRRRYWLAGLGTLCERLDVKAPRASVYVPKEDAEDLARFRTVLFASWFADASEDGCVISQAGLAEIFGRTPRTLYTWCKLAGMGVQHNLAQAPLPKPGEYNKYPAGTLETMTGGAVETWFEDPDERPNLVWFERVNDELVLTWKMANTYVTTLTPGPKTTLQKRASRRAPDLTGAGANDKMYYRKESNGRAIAKAIQRGNTVYWETGKAHPKSGEAMWLRLS